MSRFAAPFHGRVRNCAVLGAVLLLGGLVLLGITGHGARSSTLAADALGGFVLAGNAARPGPASNGNLVLAVGMPKILTPARDAQFGVAVAAPALLRKVEMFQWQETDFGGQRTYQLDWYGHPIDSSGFAQPAGHTNPAAFPIDDARFDSADVEVAGFRLAPALVRKIAGAKPLRPALDHVPANLAATFTAHGGVLTTSSDTARPQVGDLRISWQQIDPDYLTVFARDKGGMLVPTSNQAGDPIARVLVGRLSLTETLADAPQPPRLKWLRRLLAVLLVWAGAALLLPRRRRRDLLLALALAAVPLGGVAAAYWWGVRTPAAIVLALIAIAGVAVATWRWRHQPVAD